MTVQRSTVPALVFDPVAGGDARECPRCGDAALVAADASGWEVACVGGCGAVWQGSPGQVVAAVGVPPRLVWVQARGAS